MTAETNKPLTGRMRPDGSCMDLQAYEQAGVGPLDAVGRCLHADCAMRRPLFSCAKGDELTVNLDNGRIVDPHIAPHLRLRLGRSERRDEEKRERQPERPARSFSPNCAQGGFSSISANAGERLLT